jgi:hypothetical protein
MRKLLLVGLILLAAGCIGTNDTSPEADARSVDDAAQNGTAEEPREHPEDQDPPEWAIPSEASLQPASRVGDPRAEIGGAGVGGTCTTNFVFYGNGTHYIGAAGHCFQPEDLGMSFLLAQGVRATLVYDSQTTMDRIEETDQEAVALNDFALLEVEERPASTTPAIPHWGGPQGIGNGTAGQDTVLTFGNSSYRPDGGDVTDPRQGIVIDQNAWILEVYFLHQSVPGDSGSPVLSEDHEALGVLKSLRTRFGTDQACAACNGVVKLSPAVSYMEEHTDLSVHLASWEPREEPLGP